MAKTLSIYLSTPEAKALETICEDFGITPYKAMRLGFQILCRACEQQAKTKKKASDSDSIEATINNFLGIDEEDEKESENNDGEIEIED